jgi:hypothetical protein
MTKGAKLGGGGEAKREEENHGSEKQIQYLVVENTAVILSTRACSEFSRLETPSVGGLSAGTRGQVAGSFSKCRYDFPIKLKRKVHRY